MKKKILILSLLIISLFTLTGCGKKTPLNSTDFVDLMEQNEYKTTNVNDQFSEYPQIKNAFIAQNSGMTYQIEYYELDTEENAKSFYNGNRDRFKNMEKISSYKNIDLGNYQKYTQKTDDVYSLIARIDNTIIYANVKIEYKDEVKDIVEKLGY